MKLFTSRNVRPVMAFTMIEVAICLAIIGIALVGIIGVLPRGMNTQRDNREETIIGQDANMLMEMIRNGARGQDDLTNYVFAVTNYWTVYNPNGSLGNSGSIGYTYLAAVPSGVPPTPYINVAPINCGSNIVSLLSTPEYIDVSSGAPLPSLIEGGISNHVVAYMRSMSGLAAEKPPQDNALMQGDTFTYRVLAVNAPMALAFPFGWNINTNYADGDQVYYHKKQWQWEGVPGTTPAPDQGTDLSTNWIRCNVFTDQLSMSQREIRLKFLWPQLPNGNVGNNYQNFRSVVGGQLMVTNNAANVLLYYYQPQSFVQLP